MPNNKNRLPLKGSERAPMPNAQEVGPANPSEQMDVTIFLRSRSDAAPLLNTEWNRPIRERKFLSREEFERQHGAHPESIAKVEAFAREFGLKVKEKSAARRTVVLSGTVAAMNQAFGVELKEYRHSAGNYRCRVGTVQIPAELADVVSGVFGLDNRPQARPHFRRRKIIANANASNVSYTPLQVSSFYQFPASVNGKGQCIALIELGGGFKESDLKKYWTQLKLATTPAVSAVSVGQGSNSPTGDANGPDGEVMLDIEVAGSVAPGSKIVVYFADNTDAGFLNAITTAAHDTANKPSVISISWGAPESSWTNQAMTSMDEAFQAAVSMGVTVCAAAGDQGSTDGVQDGLNHVDFPASSPNVLGCGGTRLEGNGNQIAGETVWNELAQDEGATGGGISDVFPLPSWQSSASVPSSANPDGRVGRGVPDVAGNADPSTGYDILVDGQSGVIGGTSAVAPLWAGLIALVNEQLGQSAGFINSLLYQNAVTVDDFNPITSGNNGAYLAGAGWDACTGLGSPIGERVAEALDAGSANAF
jgi:kumamolisin